MSEIPETRFDRHTKLNTAQWVKLKQWMLFEVERCGRISRENGVEREMDNFLCGTARAVVAVQTKIEGMNMIRDMWGALGGYLYMFSTPPPLANIKEKNGETCQ